MKKFILMLIISIFFVQTLSSCDGNGLDNDNEKPESEQSEPTIDMDGYDCKILQCNYLGSKEGDIFNYKQDSFLYDLMATRVNKIESDFNCNIEFEYYENSAPFLQSITSSTASGLYVGDISSSVELVATYKLASGGCLFPLTELKDIIDYENLAKYGSPGQIETATFEGNPYAVTGAMLPLKQCLSGLPISVFNVGLMQKYGLDDPREFHEKKNWKWDTFETFLKDYTVNEGEKDIFAANFMGFCFVDGVLRSNGMEYVKKEGDSLVSGINSENTLQALTWANKIYTEFADNIKYKGMDWNIMNENLAKGETMLIFTEAVLILNTISYEVDNFGVLPFPCGPMGTYGKNSSSAAMEAYGILINSEEPDYAAHILNKLLDPFEEYKTKDSLKKYYENFFHDPRDIDVYFDIDKYSRHAYYPVGGYDFSQAADNNITKKSPAEIIQKYAPAYDKIIEKHIAPNYEFILTLEQKYNKD